MKCIPIEMQLFQKGIMVKIWKGPRVPKLIAALVDTKCLKIGHVLKILREKMGEVVLAMVKIWHVLNFPFSVGIVIVRRFL